MRRDYLFWGGLLVILGLLFLLGEFVVGIPWWQFILPGVLIALGLWVLVGVIGRRRSTELEEATIPLEGAGRARIFVRHGAGRLSVGAGAGAAQLLIGTFGGGLDYRVRREGDLLDVEMRMRERDVFLWPASPRGLEWSVALNSDIPLSLRINTGASDAHLDLTDLRIADLIVHAGASSAEVTLPANAGKTRVEIKAGAAAVSVRVPEGVAAQIRASGGLARITVDRDRFPRLGKVHRSADYDTALNKVELVISTGVGSIHVW